jgi:hypothetical protein
MQIMRACPSVVADQQHALFNNSHGHNAVVADQQHALFNNSQGHNAVVFPWDGGYQKKVFLKVNIYTSCATFLFSVDYFSIEK